MPHISPRTDYTYSASVSYRTHSPRKRVGSPNMSRRPLHTTLPSHPLPSDEEHQVLREGISLQQFYDGRAIRRTEASSESATLSVNFGLDHESDGEDLAPARSSNKRKHLSHRATPLLASNSLTANHASSLLSTPNGGSLFSHNECSPFPKGRTTFEGIVDALSYTAQQLVRTPTVLKNTVMSFTYSQASRYDVGANDIHYNKNNTTLVDSHTKTKTISTTADSWLHENNHRTTTTTTNTSRSGSVNRSSMVLRSRRRVGATAGTDEEEQVEFFENTQNQRLAEHDYANDDDDEHVQTSYVTSTFTSVITTVFETIYDISFEIEEAARKIIGVASRREEREKEKRLRLSKSGDEIFTDGRNSNSVFGGDNHETDVYADDESSSAASWCFWMVPLLLLIAFVALSGWSYLYHSENLKDAVTSSAAYVTSTTITVTSVVWDWIFSVFFLLIDFGKLILWAITYPFVYIYSSGAEALGRMTSGKWSLTSDLGTSSGDTGAFGVVSVVRSAFSSVLSFCLWVFSGVSELLLYIWSLLLSLLSYSESVVTSSCSTAAANVSSFMLAGTEGLWSALLWVWGVIGVVIGSALSLVAIVFNAVTGLAQSAKIMFVASPSSKIPAPRPEVPLIKSEVPPLIENNVAMIDDLVARVLQSEQLQLQLGSKVSSEVAEQTAPTAAKLEQLQLSSSAVQTENRDLLLQLQRYHDSLKQELLQLQESLAAVAADGREGRTVLSAAVQEQLQQVEEHIKQFQQNFKDINHQINKLQDDQSLLSAELKSCCQKTALSLADVESHVVGLISSLIGGSSGSLSSEDLKAWIATYFVAKDQMEERINDLMSQIKSRTDVAPESSRLQEETLVQTQQLVMERVMETLQTRLHEHDQRVTSGIRETVVAHLESDQIKDLLVSHLDSDQVKEHLEAHLKADQVKDHIEAHLKSNQVKDLLISHLDSDEIKEHLESRLKSDQVKDILVSHLDSDRVKDHIETHLKSDQVKNLLISHLDSDQAKDNIVTHLKSEQVIDRLLLELQPILEERLKNSQEITTENAREAVEIETAARSVELNDTVNALVAAAIALHMKSESGSEKTSEALRTAAGVAMGGVGGDAFNQLALSRHEVEVLVTDALRKYDADRTGLVDHALESGGGSIVSTRCTEAYETIQAEVSILGIPLYRYATNTPRSIIQPDRHPGQCWAFKGSQGFVVIRLVAPVRPTGFTLEHIPKSIAPFGVIDSAPKNFSMWGLMTENDEGVLIGAYQYRDDGEPLQYFAVDEVPVDFFPFIELKIDSNHGNMKYTCVYRVRVHGIRMKL
ncbi:hypothetical protein HAZT_HAZT000113 [Hyalella azteca]|uniref:SUN domain-containing protein n=1 Tax=Hyalella azteca TaxID=294128 RepID=A0A6A0GUM1_HYAAZ|nr:hypothetical protein HAZT_HAZT000113 [Hyalella azteca]